MGGDFFGYGGKSIKSSEANTLNTSTSTTTNTTGDIGFTGAQGAGVLSDFVSAARTISAGGFSLSEHVASRALDTADQSAFRVEETLNNLIDSTRDFSQRAIAAGTGQATPLQHIDSASTSGLVTSGSIPIWVWVVGGILVVVVVTHGGGVK